MDRVSAEQDYMSQINFLDHTTTPITDFDTAYNNTGAVANSDSLIASWPEKAAIFRDSWTGAEYDLAYASKARNRYDMFVPAGTPKGTVVFVHGGYWRRFDKSCFSHLAAGALGQGWRVAIPSYSLAPSARVGEIIAEMCQAVNHICTPLEGPVILAGHSAGGHLVSRLACSDSGLSADIKSRLVHILSLSGVHDLRPILRLAINSDIQLDMQEAEMHSPALHQPLEEIKLSCIVGADELPEFIRQTGILPSLWSGFGIDTGNWQVEGRHHFDIIDDLQKSDSPLTLHMLGIKTLR